MHLGAQHRTVCQYLEIRCPDSLSRKHICTPRKLSHDLLMPEVIIEGFALLNATVWLFFPLMASTQHLITLVSNYVFTWSKVNRDNASVRWFNSLWKCTWVQVLFTNKFTLNMEHFSLRTCLLCFTMSIPCDIIKRKRTQAIWLYWQLPDAFLEVSVGSWDVTVTASIAWLSIIISIFLQSS